MRLIVPSVGELHPADARLIRLAEFLGISWVTVAVDRDPFAIFAPDVLSGDDCLLMNADVICESLQHENTSAGFVASLLSSFRHILVHCMRPDPAHEALLSSLTAGGVRHVKGVASSSGTIDIAPHARDVCGAFSGLSIVASTLTNLVVFGGESDSRYRKLITIAEDALLASVKVHRSEVLLLGSGDVVDLDSEVGDAWLAETFTTFLPYAMVLRYIFQDRCWRPAQNCGTVIIDDPLLRPNYGFLNFEHLLRLMGEHNFATTIAFIPHNYRRSASRVIGLFQQKADQLSICFHGNDHTAAECASNDVAFLNTMLGTAQARMGAHEKMTGLRCDPIMVFPQGKFSSQAMSALRSHNFEAAINTGPLPYGQCQKLTLRELAQPAILRYAGFPLFLRKYSIHMQDSEIAFRLFFGIPLFIVEHHDVFAHAQRLIDAVSRINRAAPGLTWCSAAEAVRRSFLRKQVSPDEVQIRAYARRILVPNQGSTPSSFSIEWPHPSPGSCLDGVYQNDRRCAGYTADEAGARITCSIDAGKSEQFSLRDVPASSQIRRLGLRHAARVFVRRRLSEMRDNYVSKSPALLAAARSIQKSLLH